jgi:translation elongation factor P/translation initiation factor 5A
VTKNKSLEKSEQLTVIIVANLLSAVRRQAHSRQSLDKSFIKTKVEKIRNGRKIAAVFKTTLSLQALSLES